MTSQRSEFATSRGAQQVPPSETPIDRVDAAPSSTLGSADGQWAAALFY
jgi:hypothetical protein